MMSLKQILAVTRIGLAGVPSRPGPTAIIVLGVAGLVAVLVCVLALAQGFAATVAKAGRPDRSIILGQGSISESASRIPREQAMAVMDRPAIRRSADGRPVVSAESLAFVPLAARGSGATSIATLRGVGPAAQMLRPEIVLQKGRMFQAGVHEVIVGKALQRRLTGLEVGDRVTLGEGADWTVVGVFSSGEDSHESELMTDADTLMSSLQRTYFNSVTAQLRTVGEFENLKDSISVDPRLSLDVKRERAYFAEASETRTRLMRFVAFTIGGVMGCGAVLAALNAMYSAVSARTIEIATLRAVGFGGYSVIAGVFVETMLLALAGAVLGGTLAWAFFNGAAVSTLSGAGAGMMSYSLDITPGVLGMGLGAASLVGVLGGIMPAWRAAGLPVARIINGR